MTIIQRPDNYSLTSTIKDFVIESSADIGFEVLLDGVTILEEIYSPDNSGKISIRDLGKLFDAYLSGSMASGMQTGLSKTFSFKIDNVAAGTTTVLKCKAFTEQAGSLFFGQRPLNIQYKTKVTLPTSREYLTYYLGVGSKVKTRIVYLVDGSPVESDLVDYFTATVAGFQTINVTLRKVRERFPTVDSESILGYYIGVSDYYTKYLVDWNTYLDARSFIYLNLFGVPETFTTRGEMVRKGSVSFDSARINRLEKRFNIERADTFETSVGKTFSITENLLLRELFCSEMVKAFYQGSFREIVITDENLTENQRRRALSAAGFTFRFADKAHNMMMIDPIWTLESGVWMDQSSWLDDGEWNDDPLSI